MITHINLTTRNDKLGVLSVAVCHPKMAHRRKSMLLVAGALLAAPAGARIFSGSVGGQQFPFIGKFAFGTDSSGAPVGNAVISYSNQDPTSQSNVSLHMQQVHTCMTSRVCCVQSLCLKKVMLSIKSQLTIRRRLYRIWRAVSCAVFTCSKGYRYLDPAYDAAARIL